MNNKLFLISAALCFTASAAQAMDQLPPEIVEYGIIPQMDKESLTNYGSTDRAKAAVVRQYREKEALPKDAILACPRASEVWQALQVDTPKKMEAAISLVTVYMLEELQIGQQKWTAKFTKEKTPDGLSTDFPEGLKDAQLTRMTLDRRMDLPSTPQRINCLYKNIRIPNSQGTILITRHLLPSEWEVMFSTCTPRDSAYAQKVNLTDRGSYPPFSELFMMEPVAEGPLPDGLQVICAQEEKEVPTSTP